MGDTYTQEGDSFLPDLKLLEEESKPIGIWGQRHKRYWKEYKRVAYTTLLTSGKWNAYLADIDEQAKAMFFRLVKQMTESDGHDRATQSH